MFNTAAMQLGFEVVMAYEDIQAGSNFDNISHEYRNYTTEFAIVFLFVDFVVYLLLALYFD